MTARPRGFLHRDTTAAGATVDYSLLPGIWFTGNQTPGWNTHVQTDMAQLCSNKALPSLSKRGQGLAALRSNLLVSLTSRPLFSLRLIPFLGLLTE